MSILHLKHLDFEPVNKLADGLDDDIQAEQAEAGLDLKVVEDAGELEQFWSGAVEEARKDPSWTFADDEDAMF